MKFYDKLNDAIYTYMEQFEKDLVMFYFILH